MDQGTKETVKRAAWAAGGTIYVIAVLLAVIAAKFLVLIGAVLWVTMHDVGPLHGTVDPWPARVSTVAAIVVAVLGVAGGIALLGMRRVTLRK